MMLNEPLYNQLQKRFGSVLIAKENILAEFTKRWVRGRWEGQVIEDGENYRICCPYCGDTHFHLYISYLYGTVLHEGGLDIHFGPLAHCFRETQCLEKAANRRDLFGVIMHGEPSFLYLNGASLTNRPEISREVVYPANLILLSNLPETHKAIQYVQKRQFDPRHLSERGWSYCPEDANLPLAGDRLFIPFYDVQGNKMAGQCRLLRESTDRFPPKYYTLPNSRISRTLYNIQAATKQDKLIVVTEGVFDAMRATIDGCDYGVAVAGSRLSRKQLVLLGHWKIVLFAFDADLTEKNPAALRDQERAKLALARARKRVGTVQIPAGKDPADLSQHELETRIKNAIEEL